MNQEDITRIENLSKKILDTGTVVPPTEARPNVEEIKIKEEVLVEALNDRGVTVDQLKSVTKGITELTRAAHHAATKHNVARIKQAVKEKKDPTEFITTASGAIGRSLKVFANSHAVREGEMVQKGTGEKKPYQSFGSGSGRATITGGLGAELSAKLADEVKSAFDGCTHLTVKK